MKSKLVTILFFVISITGAFGQKSKVGNYVNLPNSKTLFSVKDSVYINCTSLLERKTSTIIVFWLSTCVPCARELNAINKRIAEWQKDYCFEIFVVSNDKYSNRDNAIALWKKNGWKFNILFDDKNVLKNNLLGDWQGVPQLIIIDENHKIIYHKFGYRQNDEDYINQYLTKRTKNE